MDVDRYNEVISVCCLWRDINLLPEGDETLVGPKGVSLSGGQKARLSLARCVYSRADIYLLDDPLSAVDAKVAKHIFSKCIRDFLSDKIVLLATHQVQFSSQANKIIVLNRNSRAIHGSAREIFEKPEFKNLLLEQKVKNTSGQQLDDPNENDNLPEVSSGKINQHNANQIEEKRATIESSYRVAASKKVQNTGGFIYGYLFKIGFTSFGLVRLTVLGISFSAIAALSDYYFRIWAKDIARLEKVERKNITSNNITDLYDQFSPEDASLIYWYYNLALFSLFSGLNLLFAWFFVDGMRNASKVLHSRMVDSLFKAKMSFYDFCQVGELTSRYGTDFTIIDHVLLQHALLTAFTIIFTSAAMIPMALINPIQLVPNLVMILVCFPIALSRCKKFKIILELSKMFRSPLYTDLSSTIDEIITIRSDTNYKQYAIDNFNKSQNKLTSITLLSFLYESQLKFIVKSITIVMLAIMFYIMFVVYGNNLDVSTTGTFLLLSINVATVFPALLEYGSQFESSMISVNNVKRYTELEPEFELESIKVQGKNNQQPQVLHNLEINKNRQDFKSKLAVNREWLHGRVIFDQISMRYFDDERPALDQLSFTVEGGQKIGIVGRTGAGKSSIVSALYRLYPFQGTITIDGVDTRTLTLQELRASIGVIPQDPVLFCDSLRKNLDPFDVYRDEQIWRALEVVNLSQYVGHTLAADSALEYSIVEGGRNFSVGQRQLVCLARAILRSPKVLLIDEATANVDNETDALIQKTIRSQFCGSTIITIAHRLNTVLDYDRIMVLDAGKIVEFDTVENLLNLSNGVFKSMLNSVDITAVKQQSYILKQAKL